MTEEELFDRVEHLFSTVPEPDQTFMNEGFGYFMPERPNADMSFQRAQELLQVEEHIQAHPEIEDLVLYAYFVRVSILTFLDHGLHLLIFTSAGSLMMCMMHS